MTLNRVSLMGHISRTPRFYQTDEGSYYTRFSLATQESWKDARGQMQTRTQWHPVVVFSQKMVETLKHFGGKGTYVFVEGKLNHRKIMTDDGRDQFITEVLLKDYQGTLHILNRGEESSRISSIQEDNNASSQDTEERGK